MISSVSNKVVYLHSGYRSSLSLITSRLFYRCITEQRDYIVRDENFIFFYVDVIDREPVRFSRWIKEVVHIRKEGQHAMNRDEGNYQLSHAYHRFLDTASFSRVKNRKN